MGEKEMIADPISVVEVNNRTSFAIQGEHWVVYTWAMLKSWSASVTYIIDGSKVCIAFPQTESCDNIGMKNGYIPPGSEDSAGIQFQVLFSNIASWNKFQDLPLNSRDLGCSISRLK